MATVSLTSGSTEATQAKNAGARLDAADAALKKVLSNKNATQADIMAATAQWNADTRGATAISNALQSINQEKRDLIRKLEVR
jgi:hypothetical protein